MKQILYHLVPEYIYKKSINKLGNYNCKGFEDSNFIHTTVGLKEMKRIGDLLYTNTMKSERPDASGRFYEKPSVKFVLLTINKLKVKARMGLVKGKFYHIYGSLPRNSYNVKKVKRDKKGRFILK